MATKERPSGGPPGEPDGVPLVEEWGGDVKGFLPEHVKRDA
jgi:hypothetical protein